MTDKELTEWKHQPHVLNVLTSREMGAWLERRDKRRDSRILQEIRQEIERQERWLMDTDYNAFSVGIAFDAIKSVIAESECENE